MIVHVDVIQELDCMIVHVDVTCNTGARLVTV